MIIFQGVNSLVEMSLFEADCACRLGYKNQLVCFFSSKALYNEN